MAAHVLYFEIVGYLVLLPAICLFGIVGNILTLVVLTRRLGGLHLQSVAYLYFTAIAVFDLLSLVFILPIGLTRCPVCSSNYSVHATRAAQFFETYLYVPVGDVFVKASVWTMVVLTVERTVATSCFRAKAFVARSAAAKKRRTAVILGILSVATVSAIENIPTFFAYRIAPESDGGGIERTPVSTDSGFYDFYRWFDALFVGIVPFAVLLVFNLVLVRALLRRRRQVALCSFNLNARSGRLLEESRVLVTLIGVTLLFLLTVFPSLLIQALSGSVVMTSDLFSVLRVTIAILVSINASGNFVLYCLLNSRFSRAFRRLFSFHPDTGSKTFKQSLGREKNLHRGCRSRSSTYCLCCNRANGTIYPQSRSSDADPARARKRRSDKVSCCCAGCETSWISSTSNDNDRSTDRFTLTSSTVGVESTNNPESSVFRPAFSTVMWTIEEELDAMHGPPVATVSSQSSLPSSCNPSATDDSSASSPAKALTLAVVVVSHLDLPPIQEVNGPRH